MKEKFLIFFVAYSMLLTGYLANDAIKWVTGTNYVQTVLEVKG